LFAGSAYLDAHRMPEAPRDLQQHPSLFMMRSGVARSGGFAICRALEEVEVPISPDSSATT